MSTRKRYLLPKGAHPGDAVVTRTIWNVKRLVLTVVALLLMGTAGYFWHRYQLSRLSVNLISRADELEGKGNYRGASDRLMDYIRLHLGKPEAEKVRARHALLADRVVKEPEQMLRSISRMKQSLPLADADRRVELQLRLCERFILFERFGDAEQYAREGLQTNPDEPAFHRVLAQSLFAQIRDGVLDGKHPAGTTVGGALQRAIELNPQDTKLPLQLAITYRRYRDLLDAKQRREVEEKRTSYEDRADELMSDMIQRNGADGLAWLSQFDYRRQIGQLTGDDDLKSAVRLSGDSLVVRTAAARYYMGQNDPQQRAEAIVHWKHIIEEIDPKVIEA
ncbi:MAG: hypothetical protein ACKOU6_18455, partial [Planctomycetota bacterium]